MGIGLFSSGSRAERLRGITTERVRQVSYVARLAAKPLTIERLTEIASRSIRLASVKRRHKMCLNQTH